MIDKSDWIELCCGKNLKEVRYHIGGGWGDRIDWIAFEQFSDPAHRGSYSVSGCAMRIPNIGDLLFARFRKGTELAIGWFRFIKVKQPGDPIDYFTGEVEFERKDIYLGYYKG